MKSIVPCMTLTGLYRFIPFVKEDVEQVVIAEVLEVANNPDLNKNRGSTVQGDR